MLSESKQVVMGVVVGAGNIKILTWDLLLSLASEAL